MISHTQFSEKRLQKQFVMIDSSLKVESTNAVEFARRLPFCYHNMTKQAKGEREASDFDVRRKAYFACRGHRLGENQKRKDSVMQKKTCLCLLLAVLLFLSGCGTASVEAEALVCAMMAEERPLPAGRLYVLSAPQDAVGHPNASLLSALFGNGTYPSALDAVEDGAFYLSFSSPCEFAVFLCKSTNGTEEVASMCLARLAYLKRYWGDRGQAITSDHGTVTVKGRWVILCLSSDTDAALRAFRRTL